MGDCAGAAWPMNAPFPAPNPPPNRLGTERGGAAGAAGASSAGAGSAGAGARSNGERWVVRITGPSRPDDATPDVSATGEGAGAPDEPTRVRIVLTGGPTYGVAAL